MGYWGNSQTEHQQQHLKVTYSSLSSSFIRQCFFFLLCSSGIHLFSFPQKNDWEFDTFFSSSAGTDLTDLFNIRLDILEKLLIENMNF